jgi:hypothetical protein
VYSRAPRYVTCVRPSGRLIVIGRPARERGRRDGEHARDEDAGEHRNASPEAGVAHVVTPFTGRCNDTWTYGGRGNRADCDARYASCHALPRTIGTAVPPGSIPSTSTSGPPIMKSVCTFERFTPIAVSSASPRGAPSRSSACSTAVP